MKTTILRALSLAGTFLTLLSFAALAQEPTAAPTPQPTVTSAAPANSTTVTVAASDSGTVKLPYGVEDVLKLSRAQVSEDIVLSYIHNSGTVYSLNPNDIVYLRNAGVSDRVIGGMLDQRKVVEAQAAAAASAQAAVPPQPMYAPSYSQPDVSQYAPDALQSASDVQSGNGSSVYVISSPSVASAYYGGYYYGGYPYYSYPTVALGFTFGGYGHYHGGCYSHGGHYYGGYHGGYHGGGYHASGYHGGGYHR